MISPRTGAWVALPLVALAPARGALAQAAPAPATTRTVPARHDPDSGRVVLDTRLGGDSVQVVTADFRRGATYLVELRPRHAELRIRRRSNEPADSLELSQTPATMAESLLTWRAFHFTTRNSGSHFVELTNPTIGTTTVRITLLHRSPGDTTPTNIRRTLVFTGSLSTTEFIPLDSGVVYRFFVLGGDVAVSPRSMYRSPIRMSPAPNPRSAGTPLIPEFTGDYRVEPTSGEPSLQIYREEGDSLAVACVRNPNGPGCIAPARRSFSTRQAMLLIFTVPFLILAFGKH